MKRLFYALLGSIAFIAVGYASNHAAGEAAKVRPRQEVNAAIEGMRQVRWGNPVPSFVARPTIWLGEGQVTRDPDVSFLLSPVYRPRVPTQLPWAYIVTDARIPFVVRTFVGYETTGQGGASWAHESIYLFRLRIWSKQRLLGMS